MSMLLNNGVIMDKSKLILYHGSDHIIHSPMYGKGKEDNDYGSGFYTTEDIDKARSWAVVNGSSKAICNKYELDLDGLNIVNLDKYGTLAWVSEVIAHRGTRSETAQIMGNLLVDKYKIDISTADVVIGYRADDSYIDIVDSFLKNEVSIDEVDRLFQKGNLGEQVFIKSQRAFYNLEFVDFEEIIYHQNELWYSKDEIIARKEVSEFLNQREKSIILDNYHPSGILARDAVKSNVIYNEEYNYYYIGQNLKENSDINIDDYEK